MQINKKKCHTMKYGVVFLDGLDFHFLAIY